MPPKRYANVYAVILAGGAGKRLRPLSTDARPKVFLSVTRNRRTMLRNTFDGIAKLIGPRRVVVVANKAHFRLVKRDLPKASHGNIILEPVSRNTAPAIALAGRFIAGKDEDAIMLVLPADQYVTDRRSQLDSIRKGIDFVTDNSDAIAVIGLKPKHASTEYGYIRAAKSGTVSKVERFTEKPNAGTAKKYVSSGKYLWNAGIFIFRAGTLLAALKIHAPEIFRALKSKNIDRSYGKMPDISIDYAVMEKADNIYCVKSSYGWNDLGSFAALEKVLRGESRRFIKKDGKIVKIL